MHERTTRGCVRCVTRRRSRSSNVSAAVDRKLAIIRDTYAALYDEASSRRAEILEIAIVLLIVVEIVLAALRH